MPKASRRDATGNSSESVRVTRSCRSSPILPIKQEIMQEKLVLNEQENVERPVQRNYYMEAANVINDSVQLTTIQEQLTSLRNIVVQEVSFNATRDKRLTMIEEKLDKVLSYFPLSIKNNMYEPIPDQPSEGSSDSFVPGGKHYNKMAVRQKKKSQSCQYLIFLHLFLYYLDMDPCIYWKSEGGRIRMGSNKIFF